MQTIILYKYSREDGGVTVSPVKPDCDCQELVRLIADEGKLLTNGKDETPCIDTDSADGWWEIEAPPETDEPEGEDEATVADYVAALDKLGVSEND